MPNYHKYFQYVYLVVSIFFIVDGIKKFNANDSMFWVSFLFGAMAIFMFYFKRNFAKKYDQRNKK